MTAPFRDDSDSDVRYYDTPYGRFMSVTSCISHGVPKQILMRWAASETAKSALDSLPRLIRARTDEQKKSTLTYLRMASERKRDEAAELGSAVHNALEAHVLGTPMPEPTDEQRPFMWAFENFVRTWQPEWEAVELVLCNEHDEWAGASDFWAWLNMPTFGRVLVLGDYKTGKNIYPEIALQLAAYRRATHAFTRDGTEVPVPKADMAIGVHLRPDKYKRTGFRVLPIDTSDETYSYFLSAAHVARFTTAASKNVIGKFIEPGKDESHAG